MKRMESKRNAEILLALVILARSTSFVMTKIGLRDMGTFTLLGFRFFIALLFLMPFAWSRMKGIRLGTVIRGMILGGVYFLVMVAEVSALGLTSAGTVALLENTAIVFVPMFEALLIRRRPKSPAIISAVIALCGVAMITVDGQGMSIGMGEGLALLAALLYGIAIIWTDRVSRTDDPVMIGVVQVAAMGLFSMMGAFLFETPQIPGDLIQWQVLVALAILCTGFGFTLQPLAQSGNFIRKSRSLLRFESRVCCIAQLGVSWRDPWCQRLPRHGIDFAQHGYRSCVRIAEKRGKRQWITTS